MKTHHVNPAIRELAKKATEYCITNSENDAWIFEEKFAEYIVLECARIVNIWTNEKPCSEDYEVLPVYKLKETFGLLDENSD